MKLTAGGLALAALITLLAGCGEAQGTQFVIETASPSAGPSESASAPAATPNPTATESPGVTTTPIPGNARIIIDSPNAASRVVSPVEVSGTASLPTPTVVVVVFDSAGNELGRATTNASATAPAYGRFQVSVDYQGGRPGTPGRIRAFGVEADGHTETWYYFIQIVFG